MAAEEVLSFLEEYNRPFSANDVMQGIKGDFGKSSVQKALDGLVTKKKVVEKLYNKQKVYFVAQTSDIPASELKENLLQIDRQINGVVSDLKKVSDEIRCNAAEVSETEGKMTLEQAIERKVELSTRLNEIKSQLEKYANVETVCPKEKERAEKNIDKNFNTYRKRKRLCMDVLNTILENYPKSKKHLFEDVGIETDEDVQFDVNNC